MNYNKINEFEYCNGSKIGISLFVQGCHFHCTNCFNPETWDFDSGVPWDETTVDEFIELADKDHIKRISILGGSPLADENVYDVYKLVVKIREKFSDSKSIWLYTGYTIDIKDCLIDDNKDSVYVPVTYPKSDAFLLDVYRSGTLMNVDYVVDGRFIEEEKDLSLEFRGSKNQRIIDMKKSLSTGDVVLWDH